MCQYLMLYTQITLYRSDKYNGIETEVLKHYYAKAAQHIIAPVVLKENPISSLSKKIML